MPSSHRPDHSAAGDAAFVISQHWDGVYRVCLARLSHPADAEDATQETFVEWLRAEHTEEIANLTAWLNLVAVRVCIRTLRRRYRTVEQLTGRLDKGDDGASMDPVLESVWFDQFGRHLPALDRRVLRYLYLNQLSVDEAALRLGVTGSHLRVISFRARRRAKSVLEGLDLE
jgi:RNA polymerase sigma factor (sigma-70 family)